MDWYNQEEDDTPNAAKKSFVKADSAPKKISHLQFGLLSAVEIQRMAEFQVTSRELFTLPSRSPAPGGCLDPRLGVSDKVSTCQTCKRKLDDCAGHFGYIKLALPVFHIGYLRHTLHILQCICKSCSRILLTDSDRIQFLNKMRNPRTDALAKGVVLKKVIETCKKSKQCPYCSAINGTVKKLTGTTSLKIMHEKYKHKISEDDLEILIESMEQACQLNKDVATAVKGGGDPPKEDLLPSRVLELFKKIPDDDCEVMWVDPLIGRPENLILQNLLVSNNNVMAFGGEGGRGSI